MLNIYSSIYRMLNILCVV